MKAGSAQAREQFSEWPHGQPSSIPHENTSSVWPFGEFCGVSFCNSLNLAELGGAKIFAIYSLPPRDDQATWKKPKHTSVAPASSDCLVCLDCMLLEQISLCHSSLSTLSADLIGFLLDFRVGMCQHELVVRNWVPTENLIHISLLSKLCCLEPRFWAIFDYSFYFIFNSSISSFMHLLKMLSIFPFHFGSLVAPGISFLPWPSHHSYLSLPHSRADDITFHYLQGQA